MSTTVTLSPTRFTKVNGNAPSSSYTHAASQEILGSQTKMVMQFTLPAAASEGVITSAQLKFRYAGGTKINGSQTTDFSAFTTSAGIYAYKSDDVSTSLTFNNYESHGELSSVQSFGLSSSDVNHYTNDGNGYVWFDYSSGTWNENVIGIINGNIMSDIVGFVLDGITTRSGSTSNGTISNVQLVVTYEAPSAKTPSISFPSNVYLKQGSQITLSWIYNSNGSATQTGATVEYHDSTTTTFTVATIVGTSTSYTIPNELAQGLVTWRVKTTDTNGNVSDYATATFTIIGRPAAPYVNDVPNTRLTTISWNSTEQQAYRLALYKGDELLESREGSENIRSFSPNMFLENGTYSFKISVSNTADMWSVETQKIFTINVNNKPSVPSLSLSGIVLDAIRLNIPSDGNEYYIVKNNKVIGKTVGSYNDYEVIPGVTYQYKLRAYNGEDYSDSTAKSRTVDFTGIYLHGKSGVINLQYSENTFMPLTENASREKKVLGCSGREYGLVEMGESRARSITRQLTVKTRSELDTIKKLYEESDVLYRDTEGNCLHVTITDIPMTRWQGFGYTVQITMQQIDVQEVKLND